MTEKTRVDEADVNLRLRELGASRQGLLQAVKAAVVGYDGCTDNDPPGARGYETYRCGTRDLRAALSADGFERDDKGNLASAVNKKTGVRIVVLNTDDATGDLTRTPANRRGKGVLHERAIEGTTGWFEGMEPEDQENFDIWYLCVFVSGEKVTAELSRPDAIVGGFIVAWKERIILVRPGEWDRLDFGSLEDDAPEIEVSVQRK